VQAGIGSLPVEEPRLNITMRYCTGPGYDFSGTAQVTMRGNPEDEYTYYDTAVLAIARAQSSVTVEDGRVGYTRHAFELEGSASLTLRCILNL
jgi:hypothetical protein